MEEKVQFNILQKHIDNGIPCDPDNCPIAIAFTPIVQATNPTWEVQVGPQNTYIVKRLGKDPHDYETLMSFKNSPLIQNWISTFDDFKSQPVEYHAAPPNPVTVKVDPHNETIKLIGEA